MRAFLILASLLLSPAASSAQAAWSAELSIDHRSFDSCSRSMADTQERITLRLVTEADGRARLEIERLSSSTFSSVDDQASTRTTAHQTHRLNGRMTRSGDVRRFRFGEDEHASVRYSGYGTLPLPAAEPRPVAFALECRPESLDVQGASASERAGLRCAFTSDVPSRIQALADGFPLVEGRSLVLEHDTSPFADRSGPHLRFGPGRGP